MVAKISGGDMEAIVLGEILEDAFEGLDSSQELETTIDYPKALETDSSQDIGSNRALEEIVTKQGDGNEIFR